MELTQGQLDEELGNGGKWNIRSKHQMYGEWLCRPRWHFIKTNRSRHNNLRIVGIPETTNETCDLHEGKIQNILINKLGVEVPVEI